MWRTDSCSRIGKFISLAIVFYIHNLISGPAPAPLKWGGRARRNRKEGVVFWTRSQTQRPRDEIETVDVELSSLNPEPELSEVFMYLGLPFF